jgi:hypothetical protein
VPPTVIPFNARRWIGVLLGSLGFVAVSAALLVQHSGVRMVVAGVLGVAFFAFGAWVATQRLLRREPELTITDEGFHAAGAAPIAWSEVERVGVRVVSVRGVTKKMIEVVLRDPNAYIARTGRVVAMPARANKLAGYSPVNIAAPGRAHPLGEILSTMQAHYPALVVSSTGDLPGGSTPSVGKRIGKRLLIWAGIAIVLFAAIEAWLHFTGDVSTAGVGKCVTMTGNDGGSVKVVDCGDNNAKYKIIGQFVHKTEADNKAESPCDAFPSTEVQFWYGKKGEQGVIWCFAPAK